MIYHADGAALLHSLLSHMNGARLSQEYRMLYWDALDVDDYRFIYMGPTGTW